MKNEVKYVCGSAWLYAGDVRDPDVLKLILERLAYRLCSKTHVQQSTFAFVLTRRDQLYDDATDFELKSQIVYSQKEVYVPLQKTNKKIKDYYNHATTI